MRQGAFLQVRRARGAGRRTGVIAAALTVALAGCTAPAPVPEPVATPSPTAEAVGPAPEPSPTPEPTPEPVTAPVRPPEMDRADESGAIAAAEYVLRVAHYAVATGDLTEWDRLSTSDCRFCSNIRESVGNVYDGQGRLEGGEMQLQPGTVVAHDQSMNIFAVDVPYETAAVREYGPDGTLVKTEPPGDGIFTLEVLPAVGGWRLLGAAARAANAR